MVMGKKQREILGKFLISCRSCTRMEACSWTCSRRNCQTCPQSSSCMHATWVRPWERGAPEARPRAKEGAKAKGSRRQPPRGCHPARGPQRTRRQLPLPRPERQGQAEAAVHRAEESPQRQGINQEMIFFLPLWPGLLVSILEQAGI